ncbi:MAG: hypothetical protein AB7F53_09175 [Nitrososphaeraceae archaeon]
MKKLVIAISSIVITTLVYALVSSIFFEIDAAFGDTEKNFKNNPTPQLVETAECNSPCPSSAEMCIAMCA